MGDQIRWCGRDVVVGAGFGVAGLADVQLVAGPDQIPLAAVAGVEVIRGT
jgi:hypothetical protein